MGSGSFIRVRHRKTLWLVPIVAALACATAALVVLGS